MKIMLAALVEKLDLKPGELKDKLVERAEKLIRNFSASEYK